MCAQTGSALNTVPFKKVNLLNTIIQKHNQIFKK